MIDADNGRVFWYIFWMKEDQFALAEGPFTEHGAYERAAREEAKHAELYAVIRPCFSPTKEEAVIEYIAELSGGRKWHWGW